ncbi:unnamed protein product, partial [marine sediment metagenome]
AIAVSLSIMGLSGFTANSNSEYEVRIFNYGTSGSPVLRITDVNGGTLIEEFNFGETTILAGTTSTSDQKKGVQFTVPQDCIIQSITFYHDDPSVSGDILVAVYDNTADEPINRLAVSAATAMAEVGSAWQTIPLITPVAVSLNDVIWLCWNSDEVITFNYESAKGDLRVTGGTAGFALPDPFGSVGSTADLTYSIYCTAIPN